MVALLSLFLNLLISPLKLTSLLEAENAALRYQLLVLRRKLHGRIEFTNAVAQQITEAFPWNEAPRYLVRDQDSIYGTVVMRRVRAMGIRDKPTAPGSPWQNGYAERLIGSIRRECLDQSIVFGERHLRRHPAATMRPTTIAHQNTHLAM